MIALNFLLLAYIVAQSGVPGWRLEVRILRAAVDFSSGVEPGGRRRGLLSPLNLGPVRLAILTGKAQGMHGAAISVSSA